MGFPSAVVCNRTFDQYACWPDGVPGTIVNVSCPWYLPWYYEGQYPTVTSLARFGQRHGLVFSVCDKNGKWTSRNTSECDQEDSAQQQYGQMLAKLQVMYTVGYSLSLGALTLALTILVAFRKLHCMRNNIHMNLFASFILRALSILVKDALLNTSQLNFSENATLDYQVENLVNDKVRSLWQP
ncbi:hypothetical protein Z043_120501 [Scleropages formosus]|uniref:G-protein coupled receptors family 2 profile 1 domain-containing protein n=1 Tax=Scleropages formosus TaxID=113540 RepID=A0A0P7Y6R0_SCLFO|nr:hypothetical protein Z043_120501 [Scleropages formosus]